MNFQGIKNPLKSLKNNFPLSVTVTMKILFLMLLFMVKNHVKGQSGECSGSGFLQGFL